MGYDDQQTFKATEKDVILSQLQLIGRVISNIDNPNRDKDRSEDWLDRVLLSLYWLESEASPFLDEEYFSKIDALESSITQYSKVNAKLDMIRKYSRILIKQLNRKNIYYPKYKGFLLTDSKVFSMDLKETFDVDVPEIPIRNVETEK